MKKIIQLLIFISFTLSFFSCSDEIPANRPSFQTNNIGENEDDDLEGNGSELLEIPVKPSGAIKILPGSCGCKDSKPITLGDCVSYCASKPNNTERLYFETLVTEDISLTSYEDVNGWCLDEVVDPNTGQAQAGASCSIEVMDRDGNTNFISYEPAAGTNKFDIDIASLDYDKNYRLTIVENFSGARSDTFQIQKFSKLIEGATGPLALMPVNQYACLFRDGSFNGTDGSLIINNVNTFHFYFIDSTRPEPLSASSMSSVFCHDTETYGTANPVNSPLLKETNGSFAVWNALDPRFYDLIDGNGQMDIHDLIKQAVQLQGATLSSDLNLFFPLQWPNGLDDGDTEPGSTEESGSVTTTNSTLGYYMTPWIDDSTYKAYCPTLAHYYSNSPVFKAMKDYLGETEGLYAGKRENACDFILVKESLLKQIWFYTENGQNIQPNDNTIQNKQVKFYWPADVNSPYIKKSHQKVFQVKGSEEINCNEASVSSSTQSGQGVSTVYPPHDKRIGCIPKLN